MAREALHEHDDRAEPDWVFWVDDTEIDIMAGRCWAELRRPLRAVPALEQALSTFQDTQARDKALYLTWLAHAYIDATEIERAVITAAQAMALADGVASVRPMARVKSVARRMGKHRQKPEVAEFLDQTASAFT